MDRCGFVMSHLRKLCGIAVIVILHMTINHPNRLRRDLIRLGMNV